jgi:hypothetical protein
VLCCLTLAARARRWLSYSQPGGVERAVGALWEWAAPRYDDSDYEHLKRATKVDRVVWHYTDWQGFEGIIKSDELWASDCRFMNDSTEVLHAIRFCAGLCESCGMPHVEGLITSFLAGGDQIPFANVLCFSSEFDSLEQ